MGSVNCCGNGEVFDRNSTKVFTIKAKFTNNWK